jgi:Flp pilus assembly protein TadD
MSATDATTTFATIRVGRNNPCPCGSGQKFKRCCQGKDARAELSGGIGEKSPSPRILSQKLQALTRVAKEHWDAERWTDTIAPFTEITRLKPDSAGAHYDLGVSLLRCGRLAKAVESLQRAVELQPGLRKALSQLAYALEAGGKEFEALLVYRKLSRIADAPLERLHYSAKALAMEGKLDEAEEKLRGLLVLAPEHGGTRVLLGKLLSDRGMFEEAVREFTQAIDAAPGAFERLTAVKRMSDADRPLMNRVRLLAEGADLDLDSRISVYFGLGKAFDDLGEYAEAMRHYETANGLKARSARLNRAALDRRYAEIIARYSAETLQTAAKSLARQSSPGDELPVFIVGMPRSGTTLVEQILSSHPEVAAAGELPFWKARLGDMGISATGLPSLGALSKAAEDYGVLLRGFGPEALRITDKEPRNFELLWLIRLAFPDARIIHCRRHPVDTCLSIFFSNFWGAQDYAFDRGDLVFAYRQYERLMDHWRSILPSDRFTELDYETLISNRAAETRRLISFVGLGWDDACLVPERNRRSVKTASVWQARQPVYETSVERWRRYEPWLGELRELAPDGRDPL